MQPTRSDWEVFCQWSFRPFPLRIDNQGCQVLHVPDFIFRFQADFLKRVKTNATVEPRRLKSQHLVVTMGFSPSRGKLPEFPFKICNNSAMRPREKRRDNQTNAFPASCRRVTQYVLRTVVAKIPEPVFRIQPATDINAVVIEKCCAFNILLARPPCRSVHILVCLGCVCTQEPSHKKANHSDRANHYPDTAGLGKDIPISSMPPGAPQKNHPRGIKPVSVYAKSWMVVELVSRKLRSGKESQGEYGEHPHRLPYPAGMRLWLPYLRTYGGIAFLSGFHLPASYAASSSGGISISFGLTPRSCRRRFIESYASTNPPGRSLTP